MNRCHCKCHQLIHKKRQNPITPFVSTSMLGYFAICRDTFCGTKSIHQVVKKKGIRRRGALSVAHSGFEACSHVGVRNTQRPAVVLLVLHGNPAAIRFGVGEQCGWV